MKVIAHIIVLLTIINLNLLATNLDSLESLAIATQDNSQKAELYLSLSKAVRNENSLQSIEYCKRAIFYADKSGDKSLLARSYNILGITYRKYGNFDKSFDNFLKSLDIAKEYELLEWQININNSLGSLFLNYNQNSKALEYYKKSYSLSNSIQDSLGMGNAMNNIGIVFWKSNQLDSSAHYIRKSLIISRELDDSTGLLSSYNNLGLLYTELKQYQRALGYLNQALMIAEDLLDKWEIVNILNNRASLCLELDDYKHVEEDLERAIRIAKEIKSKLLEADSYLIMSNYYEEIDDNSNALDYYKLYTTLNTELINEETSDKIVQIQKDYEIKSKDRHLNQLAKKNDTQYLLIVLLAISKVLLLTIIFIYIKKYKENKQLSNELKQKNDDLEELSEAKSKFFTLISHDLKAPLYNISNLSNLLKLYSNDMDEIERLETLDQLNISSKQLLSLVDNILLWAQTQVGSVENRPERLNLKFLIKESIDLLTPFANEKNIRIIDKSSELIIIADENLLGTSIRNLLSNAIKFSNRDSVVKLETKVTDDYIAISVIDEGIGIESERVKEIKSGNGNSTLGTNKEKGSGLGIKITKEFIEMIGGSITLQSEIGKGTKFTIKIPK